jgi:hypothetical protein
MALRTLECYNKECPGYQGKVTGQIKGYKFIGNFVPALGSMPAHVAGDCPKCGDHIEEYGEAEKLTREQINELMNV